MYMHDYAYDKPVSVRSWDVGKGKIGYNYNIAFFFTNSMHQSKKNRNEQEKETATCENVLESENENLKTYPQKSPVANNGGGKFEDLLCHKFYCETLFVT